MVNQKPMRLSRLLATAALALACGAASGQAPSPREIAARITPTVVSIAALDRWGEVIGTGTGFFVDDQGTFVTNHHVIEGSAALKVELSTGELFSQVYSLVTDAQRDIAILRIPAEQTPAAVLGSDRDLEVGDPVFVMGNPMGLDRTFSNGMVSAKRMIDGTETIQVTAAISPGSSGGPVMNEHGHVIGIATWYMELGQNLNMAVPIRYTRALLAMDHAPTLFVGDEPEIQRLVAAEAAPGSQRLSARIDTRSDDAWVEQVLLQLAAVEEAVMDKNIILSHEPVTGDLAAGASGTINLTLQGGSSYLIVGACDEDCDDVDLFLYDRAQTLLAEDADATDVPVLLYDPPVNTDVTLRVRMYSCHLEPCSFGVAVFRER
jgi:hypothetical protein